MEINDLIKLLKDLKKNGCKVVSLKGNDFDIIKIHTIAYINDLNRELSYNSDGKKLVKRNV